MAIRFVGLERTALAISLLLGAGLLIPACSGGGGGGSGPQNAPPQADAGADQQNCPCGETVTLDGTGSSDPEGSALAYAWSIVTQPIGSASVLSNANGSTPTFVPDVYGTYEIRLIVNDGSLSSAPNTTIVTVVDNVLNLDGVDDRADATVSIYPIGSSLRSFTIEAWIFPMSYRTYFVATDDAYDLLVEYNPNAANNGLGISFTLWKSINPMINVNWTEFRDFRLNEWSHVAAMFNAATSQVTIAVNGKVGSPKGYTETSFFSSTGQNFAVGGLYDEDGLLPFDGMINEVRVSDVSRYTLNFSPETVLQDDGDTRGLWRFNESPGSDSFTDSTWRGRVLTGKNGAATASR